MQVLSKYLRFALVAIILMMLAACNKTADPRTNATSDPLQAVAHIEHPAKDLWIERCASCHGADGRGKQSVSAPAINGLPSWYVERQMRHFQEGIRGNHKSDTQGQTMMAAVAGISTTDITALTELMGRLATRLPAKTLKGDLARGKDYHNNLCSACHGSDGGGNEALQAPPLNTLNDWYIVAQYEKFRAGIRGAHAQDLYGAQMLRFATAVEAEVIPDIAHFITQSNDG